MQKQELIYELRSKVASGELSRAEVVAALDLVSDSKASPEKGVNIAHVLYYIGGAIVAIGFAVFVSTQWEFLNSAMRILLTLGAGLAFYSSAVILSRDERTLRLPDALHLAGALLIPAGVFITLDELGVHGGGFGTGSIFLGFALMYALSHFIFRRNLLLLFAVIFGTYSFLLITDAMVGDTPIFDTARYTLYRLMGVGAAYIALGWAFVRTPRRALSGVLYGFGTLGLLGTALALGEWKPQEIIPKLWEIIFPGLAFGAMFLALFLKSRSMLVFGALFVIGYIGKITGEYFVDSVGWPLALIGTGFLLIGMGYLTFYLNKKYLA